MFNSINGYVLILDKAGWHTSQTLQMAENIKLMHLNPYSPEQNPVDYFGDKSEENIFIT